MGMTTSQLRAAWGPACSGTKVSLAEAYRWLDIYLKKWSYRPRTGVTGSYNCRRITGGSGYSLHAFGPGGIFTFWTGTRVTMALAVDVNWDKNPYGPKLITDMPGGMIQEIKALRTNNGKQVWGWGGDYGRNKDSMHFEIVCSPADLATGIRAGSGAAPAPAPPKPETSTGVFDMFIVISEVACIGLAGSVMFQFKDWNSYLQSVEASPKVPAMVIGNKEPLTARKHFHAQLLKQHAAAVS